MKLRWKEHELIFATILTITEILLMLGAVYVPEYFNMNNYAETYLKNGFQFQLRNILMPQIGSVVLIYLVYLATNMVLMPTIKKISWADFEKIISANTLKLIVFIFLISFLLALGMNVLTFYAKPWIVNYGGFRFLALFGYNDRPLSNIFFGIDRAFFLVLVFLALAGVRELISSLILRPNPRREFRVMVMNNFTALTLLYFLVLIFSNPTNYSFRLYLAYVTPLIFLFLYLNFQVFPLTSTKSFRDRAIWFRILVATVVAILPGILMVAESRNPFQQIIYILFLIFIFYPICWLLYRLRADQILQLRGVETALAKSTANLQALKSQINPHFLFNALNTLYGTALTGNTESTAEGIQKLGDMMRFMLHENEQDSISMEKEIGYLKNYIALQKLRTQASPDIVIEDNIDEARCNQVIAPMLLIPFVENAFKHGISLRNKSWIRIILNCTENEVSLEVRNSVHPKAGNDPEKHKSGIGLRNVKERLKLLYPGKHSLQIHEGKDEFVASLAITK